jgi:signal transduction histidine kinase
MNSIDAMKEVDGMRELTIQSQKRRGWSGADLGQRSGMGLPMQQADKIFDAFFTTKTHSPGMGMGLRISRSIVESHGGRLWAADNPPCGARFCFTLSANGEKRDSFVSPDRADPAHGPHAKKPVV